MTTLTARPTTYRGIKMRSRLEARVAAELDALGYEWVYEPRAYASEQGQYLPDFEIIQVRSEGPVTRPTFMEVRPTLERGLLAMEQMPIIWASEPEARLWILIDGMFLYTATGDDRTWRINR